MITSWQISMMYVIPLVAAGICLLNIVLVWERRDMPGNYSFIGLMLAIAIWSIFETLAESAPSQAMKVTWSQIQYIGITSTPVLYLIFSARYSRQDHWLTRRNRVLLWVIPVLTVIMVATNEIHHWHWRDFSLDIETNFLTYNYGPWFWVFTSFSYVYLIAATALLIRSITTVHHGYRLQIWLVLLAGFIPWVANLIHLLNLVSIQGLDPTPLAFAITGFLLTINITVFRLIDITPIARDKLVDTLQDALIVVDQHSYIADLNPAALSLMKLTINEAIKRPAVEVLRLWPYLANRFQTPSDSPTEYTLIEDLDHHWYDTHISTLKDSRQKLSGYLIILRDITEQRKSEAERNRLAAVIEQAQETIVITDLKGDIIYANPYFENITGYSVAEALGKNPRILKGGKHDMEFYTQLWETITKGEVWSGTFINKRKDGSEYYEAASIFPIKNKSGTITNYAAVKRDISVKVMAEKAIKDLSDQMTALHEISIELSLIEKFDDLCLQALVLGRQRFGFDRMGLWFVDPSNPDYLIGTFGIDEHGQLRDERGQGLHVSNSPNYLEFLKRRERIYHLPNTALRNEKSEIVGTGDLAIAGMWDKGNLIGYIAIDNLMSKEPISEQQLTILVLLSQTLGNLVVRKRDEENLQTFSDQLAYLHDVSIALSQCDYFDEMCKRAVELGSTNLGFTRIGIWFIDPENPEFIKGSFGIDERGKLRDERQQRTLIEPDSIHMIFLSGSPRVYHQQNVALYDDQNKPVGSGDMAASALWDGSKIIGYICVDNLLSRSPFSTHKLDLLILFAQTIGNLSTRIRTSDQIKKTARQQELLNEITHTAIQQLDLKSMLQGIANQMGKLFESDGCFITLWDEKRQMAIPGAAYGAFKESYTTDTDFLPKAGEQTKTQSALEKGEVLIIEDVLDSPHISRRIADHFPTRSSLVLPLIANQVKLGAAIISYNDKHHFNSDDIELGEKAAQQIALAILKNRLLEEAQTRAREAETLQQASAAVVATLKQDEAIERVLEELNRVVPYDSASVQLLLGNELEIVGERGFKDPDSVIGLRFPISLDTPNSVVFERGELLIIEDAPQVYEAFRYPPHNHIHGWMGVPLKVHNRMIGMLALDSFQPGKFTSDHRRLATAFADQVAIALENTRLFEETQWLAIHDSLTGLYNRRHFMSLAWGQFIKAIRNSTPLSAIMLDIDHFKRVNDTYGHLTGDQVLQFIADICKNNLRTPDLIGRYGGEEFVILLPETAAITTTVAPSGQTREVELAKAVAERLRSTIEKTVIETDRGGISTTISLGIAELSPNIENVEQLVDCADQALLQAKSTGRNRVVIWSQLKPNHNDNTP
jgi:diguanylate cyclase (GGDEF)-like protein/PAS domain S-box-containing protein